MPEILSEDKKTIEVYPDDLYWEDIEKEPDYQALSVPEQTKVKLRFFDIYIKTQFPSDANEKEVQDVKREFLNQTQYKPEYPKTKQFFDYFETPAQIEEEKPKQPTTEDIVNTLPPSTVKQGA